MAVTAGVGPRGTARSGATCVVAGCRCRRSDLAPFADTQVRQLTHLLSETDILVVVPLSVRTKLCILHANCAFSTLIVRPHNRERCSVRGGFAGVGCRHDHHLTNPIAEPAASAPDAIPTLAFLGGGGGGAAQRGVNGRGVKARAGNRYTTREDA